MSASNSNIGGDGSANKNDGGNDRNIANNDITPKLSNSQQEAMNRMNKIVQQFLLMKDSIPFREPVNWRELELYDYPKIIKKMMDLGTVQNKLNQNQYRYASEVAYDIRLIWKNCMKYNAEGSDFYILAKLYSKRFEDRYRRIKNEFDVGEDPVYDDDNDDDDVGDSERSDHDNDDDDGDNDNDHADTNYTSRASRSSSLRKKNSSTNVSSTSARRSRSRSSVGVVGGSGADAAAAGSHVDTDHESDSYESSDDRSQQQSSSSPKLDELAKLANNLLLLNGIELGHVISKLEKNCPQALEQGPTMSVPEQLEINLDIIDNDTFQSICNYANEKATQRKRSKQFQLLQQQLASSLSSNPPPTSSANAITSAGTSPKQYHQTTLDSLVSVTENRDSPSPDGPTSSGASTSASKKKRKRSS